MHVAITNEVSVKLPTHAQTDVCTAYVHVINIATCMQKIISYVCSLIDFAVAW